MKLRSLSCAALALAFAGCCLTSLAQTNPPAGLPQHSQMPAAPPPQHPAAHLPSAPTAPMEPKFPPVSPANFTAAAPTKAEVDAFLHASWGYDPNRVWEVYAIEKTPAPGLSKVTILVAEKPNPRIQPLSILVTPDGHHLITQNLQMIDFGPHPYEANYRVLQQRADGPSLGAPGKQFLLVEFADFECPHCRAAQPLVKELIQDFPQAHYVFEMFPLVSIHPMAFQAAAFGACVDQQGGNADFFKYGDAIFAAQAELDGKEGGQALRNAVTPTGLDPEKIAACADSPAAKSAVDASMRLGQDLRVDETPTLFIDGRGVSMMEIPYEVLKKIIAWQFSMDKAAQ